MPFDSQDQLDVGVDPAETRTEQVTLTGNKSASHQNERDDKESQTLGTAAFVDERTGQTETNQQTL